MSNTLGNFDIRNKIVAVTGGGSGINLSFCQIAHASGANILIADLRLMPEAETFVKENKNVAFEKCDVTKWDNLQNLIPASVREFGDVPDVYIAGAGVFEPAWSNFWDDPETDRYAEVDINVSHPIKLTRIAIRSLLSKGKKGVVLITGSVAGYQGSFSAPLYSTTKHAITGFTRSMSHLDSLEGIKVVTICPGIVKTPLWTTRPDRMAEFAYDDATATTPEQVAQKMIDMIQEATYPGGSILEISAGGTRIIPEWNIDPPKVAEGKFGEKSGPAKDIQSNHGTVLAILNKERGAGKD